MYLEHFGLRELPFSLTPDTSYFLSCRNHQEALNLLLVALRSGEGFTKIVGEVGTGKTLLCRALLKLLEPRFVTAYLPNPLLTPNGLPLAIAEELKLRMRFCVDFYRSLRLLHKQLIKLDAAGKSVVVLLDEAQALSDRSLETVRLLTNLETEKHKLLQVVLFGQPELDEHLAKPSLRQMRQRITFSYRLRPLDRCELGHYVEHRLRVAGCERPQVLTSGGLDALLNASRGVPRLVNILAHKALLCAYGRGDEVVERWHVRRAAADTEGVRRSALHAARRWIGLAGTSGGL
jgi:MSHA biogenesis protein MshM